MKGALDDGALAQLKAVIDEELMKKMLFVIICSAAFLAAPAFAQQYPSCMVDRAYPGSYTFCRYYWRSLGGAGQNGHVSPYQDEYGRDVARPGHLYH